MLLTDRITGEEITEADVLADLAATRERIAWCESRLAEGGTWVIAAHHRAMVNRETRLMGDLVRLQAGHGERRG